MQLKEENKIQPKVFISYSWTSPSHQLMIIHWAEQLISNGVEVVLDVYDLKEGQDKYAFMERMVTDKTVTHVLAFSDKAYSEKADAREAGVGTESQIISKEVYDKVDQSKFIPIVCEFTEDNKPCLPSFFKSRIYVDFSSLEKVNENWERLIRFIFGKPLHEKPKLGKPPLYITDNVAIPSSPIITKYNILRQAVLQDKKGITIYRKDFLNTCIDYADELRVRERPNVEVNGEKIIEDYSKLKIIRNHIIDWVLFESEISLKEEFSKELISFLERLRELKSKPENVSSWSDSWYEAHSLFVYETFLYIISTLLKTNSFEVLNEVLTTNYLLPYSDRRSSNQFGTIRVFYHGNSDLLKSVLTQHGRIPTNATGELINRNADRSDIIFKDLMEADLLILLTAFINPEIRWYPHTIIYASYGEEFTFFIRATQRKNFRNLATITGIDDANLLREKVSEGYKRLRVDTWNDFFDTATFWELLNMKNLDTLN